jgi:thiamine pyrophosphokinase
MAGKRAVLFVNGELADMQVIGSLLALPGGLPQDWLVAVDGGLRHLRALGCWPHLLIGDLDSVSAGDLAQAAAAGVEIRRYPAEKDETDLELALGAALAGGHTLIRIVGALGGRLDQTLANLFLLSQPALAGRDVRLEDGHAEVFAIHPGQEAAIEGQPGELVSLLPLRGAAEGVITRGLRYPLHGETLWQERTRGISNALLGRQAWVSIHQGLLLCIHTRQAAQTDGL